MQFPSYTHSQVMTSLWLILPVTALIAVVVLGHDPKAPPLAVPLVLGVHAVLLLLFGRFNVTLDNDSIAWRFGFLGWPRWRKPLADIAEVAVTTTTWRDGWGIRVTRQGMLYNARGFGAVRLRLRDGRCVLLGSDEPERLKSFIEARLSPVK